MTLDAIMKDIEAMREDILMYERKYGVPTEVFYAAYQSGEEPAEQAWVLDWADWAGAYELLQDSLNRYNQAVLHLVEDSTVENVSHLMRMAYHRESIAVPG